MNLLPKVCTLLLLGACAPMTVDDGASGTATGPALMRSGETLIVTPLVAGQQAQFVVTGVIAGESVVFVRSSGPGTGPCPGALGGLCLDLDGPGTLRMGTAIADSTGTATITATIPSSAVGATAHFQAAIARGAGGVDSVKTNSVVQEVCDDGDGDGFGACDGDCDDADPAVNPGAIDSTCDGVDLDCDGVQEWRVPLDEPTIQAGIDAAAVGDAICVGVGTFTETIDFAGKDVWVRGSGVGVTILDGDGPIGVMTIDPVVQFANAEGAGAKLSDLTVTGGYAARGAGIFISQASPTIEDVDVVDNFYDKPLAASPDYCEGTGVYVYDGDPTLNRVTIADNVCELSGGGYMYGTGLFLQDDGSVLSDLTIRGNTQDSLSIGAALHGAGLYLDTSRATFDGLTVSENIQDASHDLDGAGIYSQYTDLELTGAIITGNVQHWRSGSLVTTARGAGLFFRSGTLSLDQVTISDNRREFSPDGYAKGVGAYLSATNPTLTDTLVIDNSADTGTIHGLGIYHSASDLELHRSVVAGNSGVTEWDFDGGGIYGEHLTEISLTNSIVADNSGDSGGGCAGAAISGEDIEMHNAIIANNGCSGTTVAQGAVYTTERLLAVNSDFTGNLIGSAAVGGLTVDGVGATIELLNTNITDGVHCGATSLLTADYSNFFGSVSGCINPAGTNGNLSTDPLYVDQTSTSALDWDLHLGAGSWVIDFGDPALSDVDGSRSDMGAYGGLGAADW